MGWLIVGIIVIMTVALLWGLLDEKAPEVTRKLKMPGAEETVVIGTVNSPSATNSQLSYATFRAQRNADNIMEISFNENSGTDKTLVLLCNSSTADLFFDPRQVIDSKQAVTLGPDKLSLVPGTFFWKLEDFKWGTSNTFKLNGVPIAGFNFSELSKAKLLCSS